MAPGNHPQFPGELFLRDADVSDEDAVIFFFYLVCLLLFICVALQWLSALTPTFWQLATSHLLRKSTLWTMRQPMSATLDTRWQVHPDVSAYQTGSGAAPLPSAAVTVSPTLIPFSSLSIVTSWLANFVMLFDAAGDHCADPGVPAGAIRSGNIFGIDDKVKYSCTNKLFLMGSSERKCQENGQWTGNEPACYCKTQHPLLCLIYVLATT